MSRDIMRCGDCSMAHIKLGIGFTGAAALHCADRDMREVAWDDGCTFGSRGEHGCLKADVDVYVEPHAAVHGSGDEW